MKKGKQNGITLIALIITIIVMLILVGVTVTVVLNGGLFTTAKTAAKDTQYEADREILQSAVVGALDNKELKIPNANSLKNNLSEEWTVTGSNGGPYTVTSPNGNKFKVESDGAIKEPVIRNSTELERYMYGENGEGRDLTEIFDVENMIFTDDSLSVEFLNLSLVKSLNNKYLYNFYMKYENKAYKCQVIYEYNEETETASFTTETEEGIILVYEPQGREGEKVAYDSNNDGTDEEWMILYDNGDNIEMVSMSNMGSLALGSTDTEAQTPGDIDKDGNENTNLDKAIYSYNNAITRVNSYCESLVTKEDANRISVRSVGSNPSNPSSENTTLYTSDNLANWAEGKYNGIGKSGDLNLEQDLVRISYYGISATGEDYWMASRCVDDNSYDVYFYVCSVYSDGSCGDCDLWNVNSSGNAYGNNNSCGVRPVIKLSNI